MQKTKHFHQRMNDRGMTGPMVQVTQKFGELDGDKVVLNRRTATQALEAMKRKKAEIEREMKAMKKVIDKGGITLVEEGEHFLTLYRCDSFNRNVAKWSQ